MLRSDFITVGGELRQHHPCDLLSGPAGASPELRFWYALVPNNKSLGGCCRNYLYVTHHYITFAIITCAYAIEWLIQMAFFQ